MKIKNIEVIRRKNGMATYAIYHTTMYLKDIILGIDFGNVIVHSDSNHNKILYPKAIEVISRCHCRCKAVYIISKVSEPQRLRVLDWLETNDFYGKTKVPKENVLFCGARNQKGIIASKLGINCFIDDRPEVMAAMPRSVYKILFNPNPEDIVKWNQQHVQVVNGWAEVERIMFEGNI